MLFCVDQDSDGVAPKEHILYKKNCEVSINTCFCGSEILERLRCSFVKSLQQGSVVVQFNNVVLILDQYLTLSRKRI